MEGFDTFPRRMMYLPAGSWSGLVVSFSSPMSPVSPGATPSQSGTGAVGIDAESDAVAAVPMASNRMTRPRDSTESINLLLVENWWRFSGELVVQSPCQFLIPGDMTHRNPTWLAPVSTGPLPRPPGI